MVARTHPARLLAAAAVAVAVLGAGILAATSTTQGRSAVLAQLERPATPSAQSATSAPAPSPVYRTVTVGPGPVRVRTAAGSYRVGLSLAPNHAAARDGVTITLTRAGRTVSGAKIALSYSMPTMGMPQVLASTQRPRTAGTYYSLDPELAMPGTWQLRFAVTPPGAAPFTVIVNDRMHR